MPSLDSNWSSVLKALRLHHQQSLLAELGPVREGADTEISLMPARQEESSRTLIVGALLVVVNLGGASYAPQSYQYLPPPPPADFLPAIRIGRYTLNPWMSTICEIFHEMAQILAEVARGRQRGGRCLYRVDYYLLPLKSMTSSMLTCLSQHPRSRPSRIVVLNRRVRWSLVRTGGTRWRRCWTASIEVGGERTGHRRCGTV
jgi:hypothetical protein